MFVAVYCGGVVARNESEIELIREMTEKYGYDTVMGSDFFINRVEDGKDLQEV